MPSTSLSGLSHPSERLLFPVRPHRPPSTPPSQTQLQPVNTVLAHVLMLVPGWEKRVTAPLNTSTVFDAGSAHQVIAPNKVVELRESSIVLEKPFEGSTELPFFVSASICLGGRIVAEFN
jgi:hypothetical protein